MSQPASGVGGPTNETDPDHTGRFVRQPNGRVRPLSPHLQVWRFHLTMTGSILNRVAAGALSFGARFVAAWLWALASGPDAYAGFVAWMGSPLGLLIWFGLTLAVAYHLTAGIRHLIWDAGDGLDPKTATWMTAVSIIAGAAVGIGFWVALFASGKVVL